MQKPCVGSIPARPGWKFRLQNVVLVTGFLLCHFLFANSGQGRHKCKNTVPGGKKCWWQFPKALDDLLECVVPSTTQRYSVYCHRWVKKQENIHFEEAGIREIIKHDNQNSWWSVLLFTTNWWIISALISTIMAWLVIEWSILWYSIGTGRFRNT